jgi:hypothetical protein
MPTGIDKTTYRRRLACGLQQQWNPKKQPTWLTHANPTASDPDRPSRQRRTKKTILTRGQLTKTNTESPNTLSLMLIEACLSLFNRQRGMYVHRLARCLPVWRHHILLVIIKSLVMSCAPARWARSIQRSRTCVAPTRQATGHESHTPRKTPLKNAHQSGTPVLDIIKHPKMGPFVGRCPVVL